MKLATSLAFLAAFVVAQDTGTIEGVVVNKVTGAGIGGVMVQFHGANAALYEAHTNETGSFWITGVKPGDYIATVEKSGYVSADNQPGYVQPRHHVNAGGDPLRVRMELNPPAVIRGRVLDADGNPVRAKVDLGKGRTINTDAEGSFAFDYLDPGRYTLLARPKVIESVTAQDGSRTAVVPTYYPAAVEPTQAESIMVHPGVELNGYDIHLQSVPVYRVRGVVLNPDGKPAPKAVVELQARVAGAGASASTVGFSFPSRSALRQSFSIGTGAVGLPETEEPLVTGDDGVFEFPSVPAGEWTVAAEGERVRNEAHGLPRYGTATFRLGHGDPEDLKIQLAAPFHLSGSAVLSDGSPPPKGVMLSISLSSEPDFFGGGGTIAPGGELGLDVRPGIHQIHAEVLLGNYYADSVLLGSTDVTTQSVELTPASPPIKIILKPTSTIRGTIEDAGAGMVVLFPQGITGIAYSAASGADKTFELAGIPPGSYYAIALDHFDSRTMADAVRLRSLMAFATSVKVEQGSAASVQLKVHRLAD